MLNPDLVERLARVALTNVATEFPYKLDQVLAAERDVALPRDLHPAFWGSYDWHSCVHMHWTLVRLLHRHPAHAVAPATRAHLNARLTRAALSGELATLAGPHRQTFERPYGWGWLLKFAAELEAMAGAAPEAIVWRDAVRPLATAFAERFVDFLRRADYPTRSGAHGNTAFALLLALDWCEEVQHLVLRALVEERVRRWFGRDRRYPASYEPGGDDFLSAGLVEAALMERVLGECDFADWWDAFQPTDQALATWLDPVAVSDSRDAKIVHLHGVNLSRAWCWRQLRDDLPPAQRAPVQRAIDVHLAASLPAATTGDYVATHWLASFALLALDVPRSEQSA